MKIPETKRDNIRPIVDRALEIATELNLINSAIAEKIVRKIGDREYNNLVIDTIRMLDTLGGKIRRCETCVDALERKKIIRAELIKGVQ